MELIKSLKLNQTESVQHDSHLLTPLGCQLEESNVKKRKEEGEKVQVSVQNFLLHAYRKFTRKLSSSSKLSTCPSVPIPPLARANRFGAQITTVMGPNDMYMHAR